MENGKAKNKPRYSLSLLVIILGTLFGGGVVGVGGGIGGYLLKVWEINKENEQEEKKISQI